MELSWHSTRTCPNKVPQYLQFYALWVGRVAELIACSFLVACYTLPVLCAAPDPVQPEQDQPDVEALLRPGAGGRAARVGLGVAAGLREKLTTLHGVGIIYFFGVGKKKL